MSSARPLEARDALPATQSVVRERLAGGVNDSTRAPSGAGATRARKESGSVDSGLCASPGRTSPDRSAYQVRPNRRSSVSRRERPTGSRTPPLSCTW